MNILVLKPDLAFFELDLICKQVILLFASLLNTEGILQYKIEDVKVDKSSLKIGLCN